MFYYLLYYFLCYIASYSVLLLFICICKIINIISLIISHQSLIEFINENCKRIILSQPVNLLMISVITPLLVTCVIAVMSIYMGSQELPPIRINLNLFYLLFTFRNKIILILILILIQLLFHVGLHYILLLLDCTLSILKEQ